MGRMTPLRELLLMEIKLNVASLRSLPGKVSPVHRTQECVQVEWYPGDGTRYPFRVSYISPSQAHAIGCAEQAKLVQIQINGYAWVGLVVGGSQICTEDYIGQKVGVLLTPLQLRIFTVVVNVLLPQCSTEYGWTVYDKIVEEYPYEGVFKKRENK